MRTREGVMRIGPKAILQARGLAGCIGVSQLDVQRAMGDQGRDVMKA